MNFDNVYGILEATNLSSENELFIDKVLMNKIINELHDLELQFEVFESKDRDYFELNFSTYQVAMFNSEIAISMPYWNENSDQGINREVKQITNVLVSNGFTGFDQQTEAFITEQYEFQSAFPESLTTVDNHLNPERQEQSEGRYI